MIKIYYPSLVGRRMWYSYLLEGFKELNIPIILDKNLNKFSTCPMAIDIEIDNKKRRIWYDIEDSHTTWYKDILGKNDLYFKIAYSKNEKYAPNVFPIPQIAFPSILKELDDLRQRKNKKKYKEDIVAVLRSSNKKIREKYMNFIRSNYKNSLVYLSSYKESPIISKIEHWRLQTEAKICLSLPGFYDNVSWRHTEILAFGGFLLTLKTNRVFPVENKNNWIEFEDDFQDFSNKVNYYLENDNDREKIANNGLKYYKDNLSPSAQAKYILNKVITK